MLKNPSPGLEHLEYGGVKPVNEIPTFYF